MTSTRQALVSCLLAGLVATLVVGCGDQAPEGPFVEVTIGDTTFDPAAVSVLSGAGIRWTNGSATERHNIMASTPGTFEDRAKLLAPGQSTTITFAKTGTFGYYCQIHGTPDRGQRGTITVLARP